MFKNLTRGERLSLLRQAKKMTQKDLAGKLSVSDKAISKWETGENSIDVDAIEKIVDIFKITFDLFVKGEPSDKNDEKILKEIEDMQKLNESKSEINEFFKNECPYKDVKVDDLFTMIDNKPFANLEAIIALNDYKFFCKVNEKFVFVKDEVYEDEYSGRCRCVKEKMKHPYKLQRQDLYACNDLDFFKAFMGDVETQNEKDMNNYERGKKMGAPVTRPRTIDIAEQFSFCLDNLVITNVDDDRVYEKIIFLIDNGGCFSEVWSEGDGNFTREDNDLMTDLVYKIAHDHLKNAKELAELKAQTTKEFADLKAQIENLKK